MMIQEERLCHDGYEKQLLFLKKGIWLFRRNYSFQVASILGHPVQRRATDFGITKLTYRLHDGTTHELNQQME